MTTWRQRLVRWTGSTLLILVSVLAALWLVEFGLRLAFHGRLSYPTPNEGSWHVPHETRGWAHRPGSTFYMQKLAFSEVAHINSRGIRGPEFDPEPRPGVTRILIVSDSGTFGSGVADDQNIAAQLQRILGRDRYEVINLSVAAYSTVQEYLWLVEEGLKYKPELVLLGFAPGNDVQTSYYPLQRWFQREAKRPYARLDDAGKLVIENQQLNEALERKRKGPALKDRLYNLLVGPMVQKVIRQASQALTGGRKTDPNVWIGWIMMEDFAMEYARKGRTREQYERIWREGWAVTGALVEAMRDRSREAGARFAMWAYVNKLQGEPETLQRIQKALPRARIDVAKPERELMALGKRLDIPVIEMLPVIQAAVRKGDRPVYFGIDDEHMTPYGHQLSAETLATQLRERGLLPAP
jgi:lysophospholipase L1-like esterase